MARMAPQGPVAFRYWEERTMELLSEPWHGVGVLYAKPPDQLVKLQIEPARIIMSVNGDRMSYYDARRGLRHSASLSSDIGTSSFIVTMQALMNGDLAQLQEKYAIQFHGMPDSWRVELVPKLNPSAMQPERVYMTGPNDGLVRRIEMQQADGERTVLTLKRAGRNAGLSRVIELLIEEAEGR